MEFVGLSPSPLGRVAELARSGGVSSVGCYQALTFEARALGRCDTPSASLRSAAPPEGEPRGGCVNQIKHHLSDEISCILYLVASSYLRSSIPTDDGNVNQRKN